jgi:subtilisin-like proprotein convertase family protein
MTVHSWGENPRGTWHLEVHNDAYQGPEAKLHMWSLDLFGAEFDPNAGADKIRPGDKTGSGDTVKKAVATKRNVEGKPEVSIKLGKVRLGLVRLGWVRLG